MADDSGAPAATDGPRKVDLDTSVAHPARVYDYWLGGKDNFSSVPWWQVRDLERS